MPVDAEELANRIEVMDNCWMMVKMRYAGHPKLATASAKMFVRYTKYLNGSRVWAHVNLNKDKVPIASPHIGHVLSYDLAIREHVA